MKSLLTLFVAFCAGVASAADLVVTAADVNVPTSGAKLLTVQFGVAVTEGQAVYKKASDNKYYKATCSTSQEAAAVAGVVITSAPLNGYGFIITSGVLDIGNETPTGGESINISGTDGSLTLDNASTGEWFSSVGIALGNGLIYVKPFVTGYQYGD